MGADLILMAVRMPWTRERPVQTFYSFGGERQEPDKELWEQLRQRAYSVLEDPARAEELLNSVDDYIPGLRSEIDHPTLDDLKPQLRDVIDIAIEGLQWESRDRSVFHLPGPNGESRPFDFWMMVGGTSWGDNPSDDWDELCFFNSLRVTNDPLD